MLLLLLNSVPEEEEEPATPVLYLREAVFYDDDPNLAIVQTE